MEDLHPQGLANAADDTSLSHGHGTATARGIGDRTILARREEAELQFLSDRDLACRLDGFLSKAAVLHG